VSSENGEIVGLLFYTMMLPLFMHIEIRFGNFIYCSYTAYQGNGHPIYSSETVKEIQDHCNEIIQVSISRGDILGELMTQHNQDHDLIYNVSSCTDHNISSFRLNVVEHGISDSPTVPHAAPNGEATIGTP
jgi:hypothetical protein